MPHLPRFRQLNPDVTVELDLDDRLVDLVDRGLDAVIRSGELVDSAYRSRKLGAFRFLLCAAPSYCRERGAPAVLADLAGHDAIHYRFHTTGKHQPWTFENGALPKLREALICNNMEAVLRAAVAGMGIAYMPDFLARDAIAEGRLLHIAPDAVQPGRFSILWAGGDHVPLRLRSFIDFAARHLFAPA